MKKNLILVESPFQALCALEVSLRYPDNENIIIYIISKTKGREKNNEQIKDILNYCQDCNIKEIPISSNRLKAHIDYIKLLKYLNRKYSNSVEKLFIGEFRSRWMNQARIAVIPKNTYLIDDGAASTIAINKYIKKGLFVYDNFFYKKKYTNKFILNIIYGKYERKLSALKNEPINVFSSFLNKEDIGYLCINKTKINLEKNDFNKVKKFFSISINKDKKNNEIYFYGSKYSEAGIISQEYELSILEKIKAYYDNKGMIVRYFPHRADSQEKIMKLKKTFQGMVMEDPELAELYLLKSKYIPIEIAAIYSSILQSLNDLFPEIKKTCFRLENEKINPNLIENINNLYDHYKKIGINVINLK